MSNKIPFLKKRFKVTLSFKAVSVAEDGTEAPVYDLSSTSHNSSFLAMTFMQKHVASILAQMNKEATEIAESELAKES